MTPPVVASRAVSAFALLLVLTACPDGAGGARDAGGEPSGVCSVDLTAPSCGALSSFDLSECGPLGTLAHEGVFHLEHRYEAAGEEAFFPGAFKLPVDGGLLAGTPITEAQLDDDTFFLSRMLSSPEGTSSRRSYAGCKALAPNHLEGCYVLCRDGAAINSGTFQAKRVERIPGESEAHGLTLVAEEAVDDVAIDVYVAKNHAYLVARGGLYAYDVSDATQPVFRSVTRLEGDATWNGVWAKDDALYVASAINGVVVMDISAPGQPVIVGNLPPAPYNVHTVFVSGNILAAAGPADPGETLLFDVTEATSPQLLTRYVVEGSYATPEAHPHDMFLHEGRLYINHWALGYVVADVTNPSAPVELGRFAYPHATSHANGVARYGDRLIAFEGGEAWGAHLRVLDVTQPANIQQIGELRLPPEVSLHNFVIDEPARRLYLAHYQFGVRVLDISVPESPQQIAYYNTWSPGPLAGGSFFDGAIGIRYPKAPDVTQEGYVYVADTLRGLLVLRVPQ